jgi:S-adenosyl-L-methionine hydrolase (adenosine-forming)
MQIVTLLTDFGLRDGYVAQMKGVILRRCPSCQIVDISHMVGRHNIAEGAFLLESSLPYFPRNSIHVAIIDPGVGSRRLPILIVSKSGIIVGPDNGVLSLAADKLGVIRAYRIDQSMLEVEAVSSTFHGRDIFAVAAAELANGRPPRSIGKSLKTIERLKLPEPKVSKNMVRCSVLHVDTFGNVITNVRNDFFLPWLSPGGMLRVRANGKSLKAKSVETYSSVGVGELAVLKGSQGYLEVSARERSASELLGLGASDELVIGVR